jgi:type I restriction enzyme S subunit
VRIAGSFDEKIELNQNIKVAVQAMAQTVFNDWFVDFGPTRAKIEGRAPYLSPEVWQVFPAEMDSDGKPSGWAFLPLDHMANFLNGLALQKFPGTGNGDLPVIKIAELRSGITLRSDRASNQIPPAYIVEDGDVLFSWSGSLIQRIWSGGRGALNQHLFKVTSSKFPKWLHYFWVDHHLPAFQAIAASKATTMGHIQRHHLSEALTIIGDKPVMDAANNLMAPLFARLVACDLESFTLAQTRDLLLPKLMSGEIRIKEAEKAVAELV